MVEPSIEAQDVEKQNGPGSAVDEPRSRDPVNQDDSELPYSKARLITLVLTVTGAAFLNASVTRSLLARYHANVQQTLSVQAVVIILPDIGHDLTIPTSRQQWIVSAYSLTFGCFLLFWGRIADVMGKRMIFLVGSGWLTLVTVVVPFVKDEVTFDALRGLQGIGAAANVPTAIGVIGVTIPPGKAKAYAFTCYGGGAPLGAVFGNILGGVIAQYSSWRWVFWVFSIIGAFITVAGYFIIPPTPKQVNQKRLKALQTHVDWPGAVLITVGLLVLLFALTEGNVVGWSTPYIPVLIVVSMLLVVVFVGWQWYLENKTSRPPLMKISMWKNPRFAAAQAIMALFFASFSNFLVLVTYFYQDYLALSVIDTTLRFIPTGVAGLFTIVLTSYLLPRFPIVIPVLLGTVVSSLASILFAAPIPPSTSYFAYGFEAMILSVVGADTVYPSLILYTTHCVSQQDQALGGGIINAVGQVGRSIGLAISIAVQTTVTRHHSNGGLDLGGEGSPALLAGLRAANWVNFGFALAAAAVAMVAFWGQGKIGAKK